jgi:addiction module HigA family antidote
MPMFNPPHPGEVVREFMGDMTVSEFAKHLGVTRANLSMILNGRAGISAMMSLKLEEAFGSSEGFWLRLQNSYDLAKARRLKKMKVKLLPAYKKERARVAKLAA